MIFYPGSRVRNRSRSGAVRPRCLPDWIQEKSDGDVERFHDVFIRHTRRKQTLGNHRSIRVGGRRLERHGLRRRPKIVRCGCQRPILHDCCLRGAIRQGVVDERLASTHLVRPVALHVLQYDDQVFASGVADIDGLFGFVTVSYDEMTGDRLWTRVTDRCRAPTAFVVSPDGSNVFVEGQCSGGMTTIDYGAGDGARQWSRTLEGGRDSEGTDLVIGLDGTPFALGRMNRGTVGRADFVTIAYDP